MSKKYQRRENWKTNLDEFEQEAVEAFESFLDGLDKVDISDCEEGDEYYSDMQEGWSFVYAPGSSQYARRMLDRLYKLGSKLFPGETIEINTHQFQEP